MQCPETPSCGHAGVVHKQNSWTPDQVRGDDKYIYSLKFFVTPVFVTPDLIRGPA